MKNFIIKNKRLLLLLFLLLLVGEFYLLRNYQKEKQIEANKENLQILVNGKSLQINMFLEFQKEKLLMLTSMDVFKEVVLHPDDASKLEAAKKIIDNLGGTASIFSNDGILIYANNAPAGGNYSTDPYFVLKDKKILFGRYYDKYEKKDFYTLIGPIYDNQEKDKVIGAIGFHLPLDIINNIMKETFENEYTEVYLIDESGLLLSSSKYLGRDSRNGILVQEVESESAKKCLEDLKKFGKNNSIEEYEEEVIKYTNYMGSSVFGAHAYVPEIMGCVIVEESSEEITRFSLMDYVTGHMTGYATNIFGIKGVKDEK